MIETDVELDDGRTLHIYDTGDDDGNRLAVFWHHGTPPRKGMRHRAATTTQGSRRPIMLPSPIRGLGC